MGRKRKSFEFLICLTVFLILLGSRSYSYAFTKDNRTVRVAYPIQAGLTDIDENGDYCGYTYEYLEEIAQYTGWDYEFVQVSGTTDEQLTALMGMMKTGQVDLMGAMLYSEEIGEEYVYSPYSYGTVQTILQVLDGDNLVIDSQKDQHMRIAVQSKTGRLVRELKEYCQMNKIDAELVEFELEEDMIKALEEGRVDAALNSSLNYREGLRTIASFAPKPFYFVASSASASELLSELDGAITSINQTDPYFQTTLFEKYFSPQYKTFSITDEDREYIRSVGTLKAGILTNQPPYQYKDEKTGELKGISVDLLSKISDETGLKFTLVEAESTDQLYQMARDGTADLVACMPYDYATAREQYLSMTRPYISSQYTLLMNENMSEESIRGKRLALPQTSSYKGYFVGNVEYLDSTAECVQAVDEGRADYTYVDSCTAQYYLNEPEYHSLKMVPQTYDPRRSCLGVSKLTDSALLNLLNKAILTMSVEELQSVIYANMVSDGTFSIKYFVQENSIAVILVIAGVFLLILAMLLVILRQRIRANREMSLELKKHLSLYAVANDYFFEYDYKKNEFFSSEQEESGNKSEMKKIDLEEGSGDNSFFGVLHKAEDGVSEIYIRCRDEKMHWLRVTQEIVRDERGTPVYGVGRINIIDGEKTEKENLLSKAQQDSLTHLYNTETCYRMISEELLKLQSGEMGAMLLIDVDNFKTINDTYGHLRGDEVLQQMADLLREQFGSQEVIGRPGGDEFIVYLPHIESVGALGERCRRLCAAVRDISLDEERHLTISAGAAIVLRGLSREQIYREADAALYSVKNSGRDSYKIVKVRDVTDFPSSNISGQPGTQ